MGKTNKQSALKYSQPTYTKNILKFPTTWRNILVTKDGKRFRGTLIFPSIKAAKEKAATYHEFATLTTHDGEIAPQDIAYVIHTIARR